MGLTALTFPGLTRGSTRAVIMVLACMRQEALTADGDKERKAQRSVSFEKTVEAITAEVAANQIFAKTENSGGLLDLGAIAFQLPGQYLK
jgi:hypothetical protein